jgi:MFS family permease
MTDVESPDTTGRRAIPSSRQPIFRLGLWLTAEPISLIGDQIFFLAIAWTAVQIAGAKGVGVVLAAGALPRALLMLFGGAVVDRLGPRRVAIGSDLLRLLVMIGAGAIVASGESLTLLVVLAAVFGVIDALFYPATGSLAPRVVPPAQFFRVQNIRNLGTRAAVLAGAPLGGLLLAVDGPALAFYADAATFALSAAALTLLKTSSGDAAPPPRGNLVRQVKDGPGYALAAPVTRNLLLLIALLEFATNGVINTAFPALAADRGWGAQGLGWLVAAFGGGAAAAALILIVATRVTRPGTTIAAAALAGAVIMALFTETHSRYLVFGLSFGIGAVGGIVAGVAIPILQTTTPTHLLGRLMSLFGIATLGMSPLSIAAAAAITQQTSLSTAFLFASGLILVGAVACALSPSVRMQRGHPDRR